MGRKQKVKFTNANSVLFDNVVEFNKQTVLSDTAITGDLAVAGDIAITGNTTTAGITWRNGSVTTPGTTPTKLTGAEYVIADNHAVTVSGLIHGTFDASGTIKVFSGRISGTATRKTGGNVVLEGTPSWTGFTNTTGGAPAVTLDVNTTDQNIFVKVTGLSSTNIKWSGTIEILDSTL